MQDGEYTLQVQKLEYFDSARDAVWLFRTEYKIIGSPHDGCRFMHSNRVLIPDHMIPEHGPIHWEFQRLAEYVHCTALELVRTPDLAIGTTLQARIRNRMHQGSELPSVNIKALSCTDPNHF